MERLGDSTGPLDCPNTGSTSKKSESLATDDDVSSGFVLRTGERSAGWEGGADAGDATFAGRV